eukprot:TRINITY_DN7350_c0_g1_i1.p2 TRINITY_DN7350_c0_g1~~TRINITY_DN7350_c0_g1_i1.p2  ORF type:complete len:268 (-),score=56.98 TRINITY_DN7350_c0_g1_i1:27-758(-)
MRSWSEVLHAQQQSLDSWRQATLSAAAHNRQLRHAFQTLEEAVLAAHATAHAQEADRTALAVRDATRRLEGELAAATAASAAAQHALRSAAADSAAARAASTRTLARLHHAEHAARRARQAGRLGLAGGAVLAATAVAVAMVWTRSAPSDAVPAAAVSTLEGPLKEALEDNTHQIKQLREQVAQMAARSEAHQAREPDTHTPPPPQPPPLGAAEPRPALAGRVVGASLAAGALVLALSRAWPS